MAVIVKTLVALLEIVFVSQLPAPVPVIWIIKTSCPAVKLVPEATVTSAWPELARVLILDMAPGAKVVFEEIVKLPSAPVPATVVAVSNLPLCTPLLSWKYKEPLAPLPAVAPEVLKVKFVLGRELI
ncbi:MAG: hypothetical protein U1D67_01890 [Dehalococcoidia bacterium]|nr:hypothetical protein [Dehalococcoidia bacterium]